MSDSGAPNGAAAPTATTEDSPGLPAKQSAAKDKNCPYCGQAFTSSSLGRHLDLYVKDKNPKPPDGIHDVEAIRKMRSGITRRQPRGSLARRDSSIHAASTPPSSARKPSPVLDNSSTLNASDHSATSNAQDSNLVVDHQPFRYPFQHSWEATGVILDIPAGTPGDGRAMLVDDDASQGSATSRKTGHHPQGHQRGLTSRTAQKAQLDARQRMADAMDTARAAELALREILSSWRAAKQHIDLHSQPFDFDPLSLDFPALTLQCLHPPPTLFSSTPHPTSTSWSIEPPSEKQHEALKSYFQEQFQKWKLACVTATTASGEDFSYPPLQVLSSQDGRDTVKKAEKMAAVLEKQVSEHLDSTYQVWENLLPERRRELWVVELARSVGRRQKEVESLKEQHRAVKQENANLKSQIEQLNKLQQPREFGVIPPATIPIEESILTYMFSNVATAGRRGVGFTIDDRHLDLNTVVSIAIDRWKSAILASRAQGMAGQKPLDQGAPLPTPTSTTGPASASINAAQQVRSAALQQQQQASKNGHRRQVQPQQRQQTPSAATTSETKNQSQLSTTASAAAADNENDDNDDAAASTTPTPATVSATTADTAPAMVVEDSSDNDDSDEDADADMDEDEPFQAINASAPSVNQQQPPTASSVPPQGPSQPSKQQLAAARARAGQQRLPGANDNHFVVNGASDNARTASARQPLSNMSVAVAMQQQVQHANIAQTYNNNFPAADGEGDPMYMD